MTIKYCNHDGINKLLNDVYEMPVDKVKSLDSAMTGAYDHFNNYGFFSFKGKMVVKANEASTVTQNRLMLGMNVMRWLTKFYFPELTTGFQTLERLHRYRGGELQVGKSYMLKPHKPMLSWTDQPGSKLDVLDRDNENVISDYVIRTKVVKENVIWSYRSLSLVKQAEVAVNTAKKLRNTQQSKQLCHFAENFGALVEAPLRKEREVLVYHGKTSFKALVVSKVIDSSKHTV